MSNWERQQKALADTNERLKSWNAQDLPLAARSLWEEQKKLLDDNLTEVKARKPEFVNRHVLEAIKHREANMQEFIVSISTEKEYIITASNAFNAALEAERLLWKDIEEKNPPLFSYSMYTTHLVDGEEDFQHHATFDSDELDPNNYD